MKPGTLSALSCLLLLACKDSGTITGTDTDAFNAEPKVGERRLLLLESEMEGEKYSRTLLNLAEIGIEKDTVFEGRKAKIIAATVSTLFPESISVSTSRSMMLRKDDTVLTYRFKTGGSQSPYLFGLLKRVGYDTTAFSDRTLDLVFPLGMGKKWAIRPDDDPYGSLPLEKGLSGRDTLEFGGKRYQCDVFTTRSFVPLKTWIASIGLLKAEIDYGMGYFTDSLGTVVDSAAQTERYELLELNPSAAAIAAAKLKYQARSKLNLP